MRKPKVLETESAWMNGMSSDACAEMSKLVCGASAVVNLGRSTICIASGIGLAGGFWRDILMRETN